MLYSTAGALQLPAFARCLKVHRLNEPPIEVEVLRSDKVHHLKRCLAEACCADVSRLKVIHGGQVLCDEQTLDEAAVWSKRWVVIHRPRVVEAAILPPAMYSEDGVDLSPSAAPWCLLLSPQLALGPVAWWQPADMLRLRATCKAFRAEQTTAEFLFGMLSAGLDAGEGVWTAVTDARQLFDCCCRLFAERLFIDSLPSVAAAAAGASSAAAVGDHAIVAGGFALHRYMRDTEGITPDFEPGDVDVFIPYGASSEAEAEVQERSDRVWLGVIEHVEAMMPLLYTTEEIGPAVELVTRRVTTRGDDYDEMMAMLDADYDAMLMAEDEDVLGAGPAQVGGDANPMAGSADAPPQEVMERRENQRWRARARFVEPRVPRTGAEYPVSLLRRMAAGMTRDELTQGVDVDVDDFALPEISTRLRPLLQAGMLDGDAMLGRPRGYRIARVVEIKAEIRRRDRRMPWLQFPSKINVIQYHNAPLKPLNLVASFDLPPPQIALSVCPGSARPHFELTPGARAAMGTRTLAVGPNTWGPCYMRGWRTNGEHDDAPPRPIDIWAGPVRVQLARMSKYVARGFKMPCTVPPEIHWGVW